MFDSCVCCVGTDFCDEPITRPGESYGVRVLFFVIMCSHIPVHLRWDKGNGFDLAPRFLRESLTIKFLTG